VTHVFNLSYSGGRDQKDHGSKPAQTNSLRDPTSKIPNTKRAGGVAQGVGPEFKPQNTNSHSLNIYSCQVSTSPLVIISFNPYLTALREAVLFPLHRRGNWGVKKLSNL
jgi:hypothetical protein